MKVAFITLSNEAASVTMAAKLLTKKLGKVVEVCRRSVEDLAEKFVLDKGMQEWLNLLNPYVLQNMTERLLEAI